MSTMITGIVTNGLAVPATPLPEGARVEIRVQPDSAAAPRMSAAELLKLPLAERDMILAKAAELAEPFYLHDKELTGFDAFSEELDDDDYSDAR